MCLQKSKKVQQKKKRFQNSLLVFKKKARQEVGWLDYVLVDVPIEEFLREKEVYGRLRGILELTDDFCTYYKKSGSYQCHPARRSAVDIWRIYLSYFERVSLEEVMSALHELAGSGEIYSAYCPDVRKRVFCPGGSLWDENIRDEFGLLFSEWVLQ